MSTPGRVQGPQPTEQLMQLATGYIVSSALYTVTKLGIPDLLKNGAKSAQELAGACRGNEDAIYRVLRALATVGVVTESSPRSFELTAMGEYLRSDRDDSFRDMVLWMADRFHFQTYPEMLHSVKTGETVVEKIFGESCFEHLEKDKETGEVFNAAMTMFSKMLTPAVLEAYDFSWLKGKNLVDIGGGHGHLLTAILKRHPEVHGVIFDLDHVVAGATKNIGEQGLAGRCQACGGSFFENVPAADGHIMKHIIHDWSDEKALTILKNCHRAGRSSAKVILVEAVLTPGNEPSFAKWLDLEMLLLPGGRERTEEEFARLFEKAGFKLARVVRTKSPVCVLEAERYA
jgi:hypothetical protein